MGCRNSKFSSEKRNEGELVSNLKGTITFAFYYNEGVMVGVDSRSSNEWRSEKPLKSKLYDFFFLFLDTHHEFTFKFVSFCFVFSVIDNVTKMFAISNNIIAIMVGSRAECIKMKQDIMEKCSNMVRTKNTYNHACSKPF